MKLNRGEDKGSHLNPVSEVKRKSCVGTVDRQELTIALDLNRGRVGAAVPPTIQEDDTRS